MTVPAGIEPPPGDAAETTEKNVNRAPYTGMLPGSSGSSGVEIVVAWGVLLLAKASGAQIAVDRIRDTAINRVGHLTAKSCSSCMVQRDDRISHSELAYFCRTCCNFSAKCDIDFSGSGARAELGKAWRWRRWEGQRLFPAARLMEPAEQGMRPAAAMDRQHSGNL